MITPKSPCLESSGHYLPLSSMKSRNLLPEDIIMIRGEGTYSWIFLRTGRQLFTSRTIKYWLHWFNSDGLVRVHRSFVIHRDQIDQVEVNNMHIQMYGGHQVAIARSKKKLVRQLLV
jgi:two-component system LytT family response regulator